MNPVLARLLAQREEQVSFIANLLQQVETDERDLVEAEEANLTAAQERIKQLDQQIKPLEEWDQISEQHRSKKPQAPAAGGGRQPEGGQPLARGTVRQPDLYKTRGDFVVDWIRAVGFQSRDGEEQAPDPEAGQRIGAALGRSVGQHRSIIHRAIQNQTTAETPGLLPEPIVGQINNDLDAARPFVTSIGPRPLGTIPGKQFLRPYVTQHTDVDEQTAEKTELVSQQLKIDELTFKKRTFGGALNVSYQEIDWTSPSAWNAILGDLQDVYGTRTDDISAGEFAEGVTQSVPLDGDDINAWIDALYDAAVTAAVDPVTNRASSKRLPDHIWVSLDQWAAIGKVIDAVRVERNGRDAPGNSSPTSFAGDILDVPRTMVPGFPDGTVVVGRASKFEFYEQRIGLLQAIEPKILGIEIAQGGYAAWGFMDATAFCSVAVTSGS